MALISSVYKAIIIMVLSVGSCKHNGRWGIIFEGAFKTVFHLLYGIIVSVYSGVKTSNRQ